MTIEESKKDKLVGSSNFAQWYLHWINQCHIEGWLDTLTGEDGEPDGFTYVTTAAKVKAMKTYLNGNIALACISKFDASIPVEDSMANLAKEYGMALVNYEDSIEAIKGAIKFPKHCYPLRIFAWLDDRLDAISAGGHKYSDKDHKSILMASLNPDRYDVEGANFWMHCRGPLRIAGNQLTIASTAESIRQHILEHWLAYSSHDVILREQIIVTPVDPTTFKNKEGSANFASTNKKGAVRGGSTGKAKFNCAHCAKHRPGLNAFGGHDTAFCHFGDHPGNVKRYGKYAAEFAAANAAQGANP